MKRSLLLVLLLVCGLYLITSLKGVTLYETFQTSEAEVSEVPIS